MRTRGTSAISGADIRLSLGSDKRRISPAKSSGENSIFPEGVGNPFFHIFGKSIFIKVRPAGCFMSFATVRRGFKKPVYNRLITLERVFRTLRARSRECPCQAGCHRAR
jgi:hypothetical protein